MPEARRPSEEGILTLLTEVFGGLSRLWRGEIALAKAEAKRASKEAALALGFLAGAILIALFALHFLVAAAISGLVWLGLVQPLATLLAGFVLLLLAGGLVFLALGLLRRAAAFPQRQMQNVKRDVAALIPMREKDDI